MHDDAPQGAANVHGILVGGQVSLGRLHANGRCLNLMLYWAQSMIPSDRTAIERLVRCSFLPTIVERCSGIAEDWVLKWNLLDRSRFAILQTPGPINRGFASNRLAQ